MQQDSLDVVQLAKPTMAASTLKAFGKLTALINFIAWLICLPMELILHRRIGKRYMCTPFVGLALLLTGMLTVFASVKPDALRMVDTNIRASIPTTALATGTLPPPTAPVAVLMISPFGWLMRCVVPAATIAFALHYRANRKRFGTPDQGHSLDWGIPWIIYPFGLQKAAAACLARWRVQGTSQARPGGSPHELLAYPASAIHSFAENLRHHLSLLATNRVPHGPFTWWFTSTIEPVILMFAGVVLCIATGFDPFGAYLILVGVAMAFKAAMREAEMRERIYDDVDGRFDVEVMRNIRAGKALPELSAAFTVPLSRAVMTNRDNRSINIPLVSGPGFDHLSGSQQML